MTLYDIPAPAKLNLFLHVVGQRADGYHLLQTAFRFVDLQDTLHIESRADGRIIRTSGLPGVPQDADLAVRAARALQRAAGVSAGAAIAIDKRIPAGGGLGGGSSDAASVLIALNRLWKTGLSRSQLMALALPLGADVPVFVFGRPAFAEGVGERLTAVDLPARAYLVVQPDAQVPTAEVFGAPELTRNTQTVTMADFSAALGDARRGRAGSGNADGSPGNARRGLPVAGGFGRNDLEPVACRRYPAVSRAAAWLARQGLETRMSGSGACLFAEFAVLREAVLAQQEIAVKMRLADRDAHGREAGPEGPAIRSVLACQGLDEHPLRHWIAG